MLQSIDNDSFDRTIRDNEVVVVDCYTEWCSPCRKLIPTLESLADRYQGRVTIAKLDIGTNRETSQRFGVMSVPALLYFKNGELSSRQTGLVSESHIAENLTTLLGE